MTTLKQDIENLPQELEAIGEYYYAAIVRGLVKKVEELQADAERYRWMAAHCRSTPEHWGGRWSIVIEGPAPKTQDSEDDFDEAIDKARNKK